MSASKVYSALNAITDLTNIVTDRIELSPARQGIATPYITYEFEGDDPVVDLQGTVDIVRQDWNIRATAKTHAEAEAMARIVIIQLPQQKNIMFSTFQSSSINYDEDAETYQYEITFKVMY